MEKVYFSYGMDERFPFQDGYTEIEAPSRTIAVRMFQAIHPDRIPGIINCAWIYAEDTFHTIKDSLGPCREQILYRR